MAIRCPFCNFSVAVPASNPGRHAARCIECGKKFLVKVPADEPSRMIVVVEEPRPTVREKNPINPERTPETRTAARVRTDRPTGHGESARAGAGAKSPLPGGILRLFGGYRLVAELGRSDFGPRYLAVQLSNDRKVAVEVVKPDWARDPVYVARLAREAYAAAQLSHENLVPIRDFGEEKGVFFIVTEYVDGQDFAGLLETRERLDVRKGAAMILQAARGLAFAYDHGIVHGNLRPEDLLLDRHGIVKVAGLGLLRSPAAAEEHERRQPAIGDPRDDIASLGRVFHLLVASRPVPKELAEILRRMTGDDPQDRFAHHGDIISALERFLGVESSASFLPRQEDAERLQRAAAEFRGSPAARLRRQLILGFFAAVAVLVLLSSIRGRSVLAGGFVGLGLLTIASYFVIDGVMRGGLLASKTRELAFGSRPADWLAFSGGLVLFLTALTALHLLGVWLAFCAAAVLLAIAIHSTVDRRVEAERRPALQDANDLLKELRERGPGEDAVRRFVSTHAGRHWQEFHEALLGYEATLAVRELLDRADQGRLRLRHAEWREFLIRRLDAKIRSRRDARDRELLQRIEERGLVARGENLVTARRKARRTAEAMVAVAAEARPTAVPSATFHLALAKAIRDAANRPEEVLVHHERGLIDDREPWYEVLLGPRIRFLAGALLLAGCLAWMHQNDLVPGERVGEIAANALQAEDLAQAKAHLEKARDLEVDLPKRTRPLRLPMLPATVSQSFNGFGPGTAGLILLASSVLRDRRIGLFAITGAAVALLGPRLGIPAIGPLDGAGTSMALGVLIAALGLFFRRH